MNKVVVDFKKNLPELRLRRSKTEIESSLRKQVIMKSLSLSIAFGASKQAKNCSWLLSSAHLSYFMNWIVFGAWCWTTKPHWYACRVSSSEPKLFFGGIVVPSVKLSCGILSGVNSATEQKEKFISRTMSGKCVHMIKPLNSCLRWKFRHNTAVMIYIHWSFAFFMMFIMYAY